MQKDRVTRSRGRIPFSDSRQHLSTSAGSFQNEVRQYSPAVLAERRRSSKRRPFRYGAGAPGNAIANRVPHEIDDCRPLAPPPVKEPASS